ncbi:dihydrofolate reductase [Caulobacter sp. D4A]|uniref:dihydrofolate reductase family protein n=1 Tax=unclassified Caulobacter TaxID=2648921 RepID=UPI000D7315CE|nr:MULTISPECIES: dihydrofolate reductase family protein [unclassified Caulobacter]PXA86332.1 dihydrofolate reductase [Caulobacter sp. D4A]PXA90472.1 dihydrofolate reductase [Caulobacter sp. D5]
MALIRGFIAASLDGCVADADGGVQWLAPFRKVDPGYGAFIDDVGTVVMGRRTYDLIPSLGTGWPYAGKRGFVVTSRRGDPVPRGVKFWREGAPALIERLRELDDGDVWVVGGAGLLAAFAEEGALDRLSLLIAPVLLGEGLRLFPERTGAPRGLVLRGTAALAMGVVRLDYELPPVRPGRGRGRATGPQGVAEA